jgi:hypothetical protein
MSEAYRSSTRIGAARNFYVAMAMTCLLFAFTGFLPTYWVPLAQSRFQAAPIVHIHAFFFFGWTLFFVAQTYFAANRELERHREFGVAGVALATAMVFTGVLMTIHSLAKDLVYDAAAAKAFSIVSFTTIAFFAIVVTLALVNVRRPDTHKRLMLLATVSILQAPVARWFLVALRPPDAVGAPPVAVSIAAGFVVESFDRCCDDLRPAHARPTTSGLRHRRCAAVGAAAAAAAAQRDSDVGPHRRCSAHAGTVAPLRVDTAAAAKRGWPAGAPTGRRYRPIRTPAVACRADRSSLRAETGSVGPRARALIRCAR